MKKNPEIEYVDLRETVEIAETLSKAVGQPMVVAGALALAAYGYRRETHDVDIVISVVIADSLDNIVAKAEALGLTLQARHSFGGADLRNGLARIDVLTLDTSGDELAGLIPDAVTDAIDHAEERTIVLFGRSVLVVSLGYLIAMKLVSNRRKDKADILEVIKAQMRGGVWNQESYRVHEVVKRHLGLYAVRAVADFAAEARRELGE